MKPIYNHIGDIFEALTVEKCSECMCTSVSTAYRYQQPPDKNGEVIPLERLLKLLRFSRESGISACLSANAGIVQILAGAAGMKAIGSELVAHFSIGMEALNNGGRLRSGAATCPSCYGALVRKGFIDETPVYTCPHCKGHGAEG
jgi:hypothetical protein